ncbi:MAG: heavy-metal-associated domain-containing protein [Pseudomonadota bacterium]|uniref:heavy-metal-associated domain-containing protein n=1 Tax=Thermithiobacillus tepidarius TaxID=929 RepID=UPI000418B290|nr:copper ion binding protein [Thermithiobacillus tepidarius]
MDEVTFKVKGMSCQHCVRSIKGALEPMPGVNAVFVDLPGGEVKVNYDAGQVERDALAKAIEEEGYEVQ